MSTVALLLASLLLSVSVPKGNAAKGPTLPHTPSRGDVVRAMGAVNSDVRACGRGEHGSVQVRVVFRGVDGQAIEATADGPVSEPVRTCVVGVARTIRVPPFERETFSISYPFRL